MCDKWRCYSCTLDELVDLNGEVGYVEFWLLNHKKEWVPHCRFKEEIAPNGFIIDVIGCWNTDADILIRSMDVDPVCGWNGIIHFQNVNNRKLNNSLTAGIRDKISSIMLE
ncbi:hypothetical protein Tco_1559715, partial [Tanacetum coccineum]